MVCNLIEKHWPVFFFFRWFALCFHEIMSAKYSVFIVASFRDLLLYKEQKKAFVSLNNDIWFLF